MFKRKVLQYSNILYIIMSNVNFSRMYNRSDPQYFKFIFVKLHHEYTQTIQARLLITYFENFKRKERSIWYWHHWSYVLVLPCIQNFIWFYVWMHHTGSKPHQLESTYCKEISNNFMFESIVIFFKTNNSIVNTKLTIILNSLQTILP